jgi:hypothetical protein
MRAPDQRSGASLFPEDADSVQVIDLKSGFSRYFDRPGKFATPGGTEPEAVMRILILSLAVLLLLVALVFLAGWLLPATREGRAETVIAAPPDRILAVIAAVEAQPDWREVGTVTRTADGWEEVTPHGERIAFVADEMTEARIRLRFTSDAGYTGAWEAELAPVAAGTRIAVVERATVPAPLGRIISRLMFDPGAFATTYLAALKARVEG